MDGSGELSLLMIGKSDSYPAYGSGNNKEFKKFLQTFVSQQYSHWRFQCFQNQT